MQCSIQLQLHSQTGQMGKHNKALNQIYNYEKILENSILSFWCQKALLLNTVLKILKIYNHYFIGFQRTINAQLKHMRIGQNNSLNNLIITSQHPPFIQPQICSQYCVVMLKQIVQRHAKS